MLKSRFLFYLSAAMVFLCDRVTKQTVAVGLQVGASVPVVKNILHITYVQNTGAAFGILKGSNWLLLLVGAAVLSVVFYFHVKLPRSNEFFQGILGMIFGGSIGNLLDRALFGHVIDFIDFRFWPVFNFADAFINVGVFLLIVALLFKKDNKNASRTF